MMYVGTGLNLTGAILDEGWPLMDECRGKAIFVLLATGDMRDLYMDEDRVWSDEDVPDVHLPRPIPWGRR